MEYIGDRISVIKGEGKLSVVILSTTEKLKAKFLLLWLIAWSICGILVFREYFNVDEKDMKLMLIIYLAFWFYFEYTIIKSYMWRRSGKEKIKLTEGKLYLKREVNKKGKWKEYNLEQVKELRLVEESSKLLEVVNNSYWFVAGERIAFDHFGKTISFGIQLPQKDAKELLGLVKHYKKVLS